MISFDRYDSGGSDWGSSSGWSSSSDWGSSSSWGSSSDWGTSGDTYSFIPFFISSDGMGVIFLIIIVLSVIYSVHNRFRKEKSPGSVYTTNVRDVPVTHLYADRIKAIDPMFSEEKFLAWAKELYVKMQKAWTARDWEEMRPLET